MIVTNVNETPNALDHVSSLTVAENEVGNHEWELSRHRTRTVIH